MRTGGDLPTGVQDGNYSYETGIATDYADFIVNRISPFLVAKGWSDLGDPGLHAVGRLFYSTGESGRDDIYIAVAYSPYYYNYVQDDAAGTHRTPDHVYSPCDHLAFPTRYHLGGDRDCLLWAVEQGRQAYPNWLGMAVPAVRNAGSEYSLLCATFYLNRVRVLRQHTGVWTPAAGYFYRDVVTTTSPNLFDGETCVLWPVGGRADARAGLGNPRDFHGTLKYLYEVNGYYCCPDDSIRVAGTRYTVLRAGGAWGAWAIRTE